MLVNRFHGAGIFLCVILSACNSESTQFTQVNQTPAQGEPTNEPIPSGDWFRPSVFAKWHWQLNGSVDTSYPVDIYDIDLFDTPVSVIDKLQESGVRVICYFSAGTYENWRPDAGQFSQDELGNILEDWQGERWLDIRTENVARILRSRLDLAKEKGCDGVEPDNMDGYTNNPGFDFTADDQLKFNRSIADEAHARGLSVGLKNDLDQVIELVDSFDFAVNEQCFEYSECAMLAPFIIDGKPVFNVEYDSNYVVDGQARMELCALSLSMEFSSLILPIGLDNEFRLSCL